MADEEETLHPFEDEDFRDILERMAIFEEETLDFSSPLSEDIAKVVERLTQAALYFNFLVIKEHGGKKGGSRGVGLVEQVIGAAF